MTAHPPLRYPPDYPPTTRWKRFFLGVPWLGPDLRFFRALHATQAARTAASMAAWGGGVRQALAEAVGAIFAEHCAWPTPWFLPDDDVAVIADGPGVGWFEDPDRGAAIKAIEALVGTRRPDAFWTSAGSATLGALVDQLVHAAPSLQGQERIG